VLQEAYVELRQEDAVGASRSSYRITVRQLEALIRLSEALAKMNLDKEVKPEYVREATRLLKKSIIQVEAEAINLDIAEEAIAGVEDLQQPRVITFENYQRIGKLVILRLRQLEAEPGGMPVQTIDDLANWWIEENEARYAEVQDMGSDVEVVRLVIDRLIRVDQVLLLNDADNGISVHPNYTDE
jgi:DNA replication licensing factor MCM6